MFKDRVIVIFLIIFQTVLSGVNFFRLKCTSVDLLIEQGCLRDCTKGFTAVPYEIESRPAFYFAPLPSKTVRMVVNMIQMSNAREQFLI